MLILAGVAISVLTSHDGLFSKSNKAVIEHKKQSIIEAIKSADLYLELDNKMNDIDKKYILSLLQKLEEMSDINEENYEITRDVVSQKAKIEDKKTGVTIYIRIDENNKVIIGESDEEIVDKTGLTVEYKLSPEGKATDSTVTITIIAKDETNGISKIQFPNGEEKPCLNEKTKKEEYVANENGEYEFTVEGGEETKTITVLVDNIDKKDPKDFNLSSKVTLSSTEVKPYSINVSGTAEDHASTGAREGIAGIKGYQFQLKDENGTSLTDWLPKDPQKETSFDFTEEHGLEVGKSYKVSMRAVDNADNTRRTIWRIYNGTK